MRRREENSRVFDPAIPWRRVFFQFQGVHTSGCSCTGLCSVWCYEWWWQCPSHVPPELAVWAIAQWHNSAFLRVIEWVHKCWMLKTSIWEKPWTANDSHWAPRPLRHPAVCFSDAWLSRNKENRGNYMVSWFSTNHFLLTANHRNNVWNLTAYEQNFFFDLIIKCRKATSF